MTASMQAAVWHGKKDIRVETVPVPSPPPPGWVQIKVEWCGICGSDLHEYLAGPIFIPAEQPHPLTGKQGSVILGHEFSGTVAALGEGVTGLAVGDRVAPDACQHCGECQPCREGRYNVCEKLAFTGLANDGAFARLVNVPAGLCFKLPEGVSAEAGAVMEPLATGFKAVRMAGSILGLNVVVLGAGTIGLGTIMAAKAAGAGRIIVLEMSRARIAKAKECGADIVINPKECDPVAKVRELTGGCGADVSFECIGNKFTGPLAVDVLRNTGTAVIVGIFEEPSAFNFFSLSGTDKKIQGTLAYTIEDFKGLAALMAKGAIRAENLITGKIELKDIMEKGFMELINNKDENIKILVRP
ncbi:2,3-butanediol dehydrogenase [Desulfovibrio legallii]|jgi:(R,R)-butanediol dehydrogenase/meso-butanediol dehydrogenase/diacetyl reductase|uniref:(R,R)-butanediol dehydrogenase / meso-butanediol dehydrogenase / diacetyl reductase n=1 Tax=Desulfovibrio legallii TaxID=571438 RepID=A0A1G7J4F2_9BACT|nr:2,3-butanediol dehydrogenase [Desulfovibrio legallii]SDF19755.1 (R,R)-butanediol dehydrogenase / meso-butanediol dehydrogenase / diacetyl reductase [Desulfovibrio legallii]